MVLPYSDVQLIARDQIFWSLIKAKKNKISKELNVRLLLENGHVSVTIFFFYFCVLVLGSSAVKRHCKSDTPKGERRETQAAQWLGRETKSRTE